MGSGKDRRAASGDAWHNSPHSWKLGFFATFFIVAFSGVMLTVRGGWIDRNISTAGLAEFYGLRTLSLQERTLVAEDRLPDVIKAYLTSKRTGKVSISPTVFAGLDLRRRNLRGANFFRAKLYNADLRGADMTDAYLRLADLRSARMGPYRKRVTKLVRANLWRAFLLGTSLQYANLQGANLAHARLQGASLENAQMEGVILVEARLRGADLRKARLIGADLRNARLHGTDLRGANLRSASLQGVNAKGAKFLGADLRGARVDGAIFIGSDLNLADLRGIALDPLTSDFWALIKNDIDERVARPPLRRLANARIKRGRKLADIPYQPKMAEKSIIGAIWRSSDGPFRELRNPPDKQVAISKLVAHLVKSVCGTKDKFAAGGLARSALKRLDRAGQQGSFVTLDISAGKTFESQLQRCISAKNLEKYIPKKTELSLRTAPRKLAGPTTLEDFLSCWGRCK